ncbi:hypothetical protein PWT90_01315 [Aphanocladium album]|nr:hypothetical protein PWT90_01315 [Aphanocladium album]
MTSWGVNASVTFHHGRLERKELNKNFSSRRIDSFVERANRGGSHVPGVKLSINFERYAYLQFSHGFNFWRQDRLCHPEILILRLVNDITDRENWHLHVNDFTVCQAWRAEALANYFPQSDDLWDWCLCELRKKAAELSSTKQRAVFVLDSASRVCKSDRLVGTDLFTRLKADTNSLWVSPWMFPFIFGVSPLRTDGKPIKQDNCLDCITVGNVDHDANWDADRLNNGDPSFYSNKSQWIATDVRFSSRGNGVTILSPINNLHPVLHSGIYGAVGHLVSDLIDDWNKTLLYKALARGVSRAKPQLHRCISCSRGNFDACSCRVVFREYSAWEKNQQNNVVPNAWHEAGWNPVRALDGIYSSSNRIYDKISLRDGFKYRGLQVYVEISTIKVDADGAISPDSVHYLSWNLNGNRNERIVATSLICLRRDNIHSVSGGISFRTETKLNTWEDMPKSRQNSNEEVTAGPSSAPATAPAAPPLPGTRERVPVFQELGTVKLPEGRVVTYPNTLQHKFETPQLKEPGRTGCIQFMQIHLVDPHYIVCSTRYVPPQNLEWWKESIEYERFRVENGLPHEITYYILERLLVPEKYLSNTKRVRGLNHYWQTISMDWDINEDNTQPCQPPIRYETALRLLGAALQKHDQIMESVNGAKLYGRARAFTVWLQSMLGDPRSADLSDPRDHESILLPETEDNVADAIGSDAANNIPDIEEEYLKDWDSLLEVESSSSSEGSTDGEPESVSGTGAPMDKGKGRAVDLDDGGDNAQDGTNTGTVPDPGEDIFFDAQYGLTLAELAELAEIQEEMAHPSNEEELESLYDDAMSHADELEDEELDAEDLDAEGLDAEDLDAEDLDAEDLDAEDMDVEHSDAEELVSGDLNAEELVSEDLALEGLDVQESEAVVPAIAQPETREVGIV